MKKISFFAFFVFFISFFSCAFTQEPILKIHFLDAGEGEAILIETPEGKTILIDAGNCITGLRVVEYLKKNNIYTLDHLIFTHPHLDHICGAFFVVQVLKPQNIYDNGENLTGLIKHSDIYRWYAELVRKDKNYKILKAKDALFLNGVTLRALWPAQPFLLPDSNANSLVIMLEYGKFRCLLTGDLTAEGEGKILEEKENIKADVLKIGHHGALDANSEGFLTGVSPKIAIISVNKANIRGYPAKEVLGRLKKAKVQLYRTDEDGDIVLNIRQSKYKGFNIQVNKTQY